MPRFDGRKRQIDVDVYAEKYTSGMPTARLRSDREKVNFIDHEANRLDGLDLVTAQWEQISPTCL